MIQKPPGLIDRAAAITVLSPPIHDYVMISHVGAPPRRSHRARLSSHLESLFSSSRLTLASHLHDSLRIFVLALLQIVSALNFSSAYSSSLAAHLWLLNSIPRVNSCPTSNPRSPQGQMRTSSANHRQPTDISPQITTVHLFLAGGIIHHGQRLYPYRFR
jgi:hypothetical protein